MYVLELDQLLRSKYDTDIPSLVGIPAAMYEARQILKELGITGGFKVQFAKGGFYVIIKGYAGLRHVLDGVRYLPANPKVVGFGIGPVGAVRPAVRLTGVAFVLYVSIGVLKMLLEDDHDLADFLGRLGADLSKFAVSSLARGFVQVFATMFGLPYIFPLAIGIGVGLWVNMELNDLDDERLEKELADHIREYLNSPKALTQPWTPEPGPHVP